MSQQSQLFDQSDVSSKDSFLLSSENEFKVSKNIQLMAIENHSPEQPPEQPALP